MEDKNPIEIKSLNEDILKGADMFVKAISILIQKDLDQLKKNVEGIADVVKLQNKHK